MTPKEIFEDRITKRLNDPENQAQAKELDAIYQFNVTGDDGGNWVVNLKTCKVSGGESEDADCTITIDGADLVSLVDGSVSGPQLFMGGRLQIAGNMSLAMKLGQVLGT